MFYGSVGIEEHELCLPRQLQLYCGISLFVDAAMAANSSDIISNAGSNRVVTECNKPREEIYLKKWNKAVKGTYNTLDNELRGQVCVAAGHAPLPPL
jgi:hypothetical protein